MSGYTLGKMVRSNTGTLTNSLALSTISSEATWSWWMRIGKSRWSTVRRRRSGSGPWANLSLMDRLTYTRVATTANGEGEEEEREEANREA